jgi:hypothetical protein
VNQQYSRRVPDPQSAGQEQDRPRERGEREQPLRDLDELAAVEAIGQRPAYTEKSRNGTQWLMTANPASIGEWNAWKMTQ